MLDLHYSGHSFGRITSLFNSEAHFVGKLHVSLELKISDDRPSLRCWKVVITDDGENPHSFAFGLEQLTCFGVYVLSPLPNTHTCTHNLYSSPLQLTKANFSVYSTQCFIVEQIKHSAKLWVCLLQLWPTPSQGHTSTAALFPHLVFFAVITDFSPLSFLIFMPPTPPVFALKKVSFNTYPILLFNHSSNVNQLPLSFLPFYPWSHRPFLRASWLLLSHLWGVIFELKHSPWFCSAFSHLPCYPFFPQTLQLLWSNPPLFVSSPSHAQEYILPCMWIHSRACSHVACAGAAACDVKPDPFFSQADHQEWGLRLTVHRAPWRSHLPPFLSFFFFSSWWDDIIQGGRRMATRWKANNQKLWLCTVSM